MKPKQQIKLLNQLNFVKEEFLRLSERVSEYEMYEIATELDNLHDRVNVVRESVKKEIEKRV